MRETANPAALVDAPIASLFTFLRQGQRATEQRYLNRLI